MTRQEWFLKQGIAIDHNGNGRITKAWYVEKPSLFQRFIHLFKAS